MHVSHVPHPRDFQKPRPEGRRSMRVKKLWLEAFKETIEGDPEPSREDSRKPTYTTVQNVRKSREAENEAVGEGGRA